MKQTVIPLAVVLTLVFGLTLVYAETSSTGLIRVTPSYHQTSYAPPTKGPVVDAQNPGPPTPKDQMYVFWIFGKILSYPIDKVEEFVTRKRRGAKAKSGSANISAVPNPFEAADLSQIPPAPPVVKGAAATSH